MKKFFTIVIALVAVLAANASTVVFDFTKPATLGANPAITAPAEAGNGVDLTDAQTFTVSDVVMSQAKVATTANRIWNNGGTCEYRTYTKSTLTFTATDNITAIVFEGSAVSFSEFTGKTWTGEAKSVTLTASATCKFTKATLTVGEAAVVWKPDTITVSQANALIASSDAHDHFVKGVVMCEPFITYASFKDKVSFWMKDVANANDTIEFYDGMGLNNQKWESLDAAKNELRIGDTILVYAGGLASYTNATTHITFNEITGGYYAQKLGANPNPPAILGPDTVTVAKAIEIGTALADNAKTTVEYVVKGFACTTYEPNEGYTDQTWFMHDTDPDAYATFQAFQCEPDEHVAKGDYMLVRGYIMKYVKDTKVTIEISKGTAVHGTAPKIDTVQVNVAGAMAAVEDMTEGTTTEIFAVTGYVAKVTTPYSEEYKNETFFMTDTEGATYGDLQVYRGKMLDEKACGVGDQVLVVGFISKSSYGVEMAEGSKVTILSSAQGIEEVQLTEKVQKIIVDGVLYIIRDNKMYNAQGVQVR